MIGQFHRSLVRSGKPELLEGVLLGLNLLDTLLRHHGLDHIKLNELLIEVTKVNI